MATKTISLRIEAYERLKAERRYQDESFSGVVIRANCRGVEDLSHQPVHRAASGAEERVHLREQQSGNENQTGLHETSFVVGKARAAVFRSSRERAKEFTAIHDGAALREFDQRRSFLSQRSFPA
jgi:hypothetical protein